MRIAAAILLFQLAAPIPAAYLGFDSNQYPGDERLSKLRQRFWYAGYWLNNPPGEKANPWRGKREAVEAAGFGFLILFNGQTEAELRREARRARSARDLGRRDAAAAVDAARQEGFPADAVIFLDQEEGGRMTPSQRAYIHAWVDGVNGAGYRAGVYCSGIPAAEGGGATVVTASDIRENAGKREIIYWVAADACPPSTGCVAQARPPGDSGVPFAAVWQFAQSPGRKLTIGRCAATYNADGNCYAPVAGTGGFAIDMNTANTSDPSHGRRR